MALVFVRSTFVLVVLVQSPAYLLDLMEGAALLLKIFVTTGDKGYVICVVEVLEDRGELHSQTSPCAGSVLHYPVDDNVEE